MHFIKLNKKLTAILLCLVTAAVALSQENDCSRYCNFKAGAPFDTLQLTRILMNPARLDEDTATIQRVVERILCLVKLDASSYKTKAYTEDNACAIECDKIKYILYNTDYLTAVSSNNFYIMFGILAHEIGHHVLGNAWLSKDRGIKALYDAEYAADEFAGMILGKLNVPYDTALQCLNGVDEVATLTHPAKKDRILYFKQGWSNGQQEIIPAVELTYDINCQSTIKSSFKITYAKTGSKRFLFWKNKKTVRVYVQSVDGTPLSAVDHIDYYLHPTTFKRNVMPSSMAADQFAIYLNIYGEFEVRGTVHMKNGSELLLTPVYLNVFNGHRRKQGQ